jgi:hypothetical protein
MRTRIITIWLLLLVPTCLFAAGDTNEFIIFSQQATSHGPTNTWRISEARALSTPEWIPGKSIPLSPDKAWEIARDWALTHDCLDPFLVSIEIRPLITTRKLESIRNKFYYRLTYGSQKKTPYAKVVILMDGTVLEPK